MEVFIPVQVFECHRQCDKCQKGLMLPSKITLATGPIQQYSHTCSSCGHTEMLPRPYPYIHYEYATPEGKEEPIKEQ